MSEISRYPTKDFKETQKFFVYDPSTGSPNFVTSADFVANVTSKLSYVRSKSTRAAAQKENYKVGTIVQTAGTSSPGYNEAATYLVVNAGEGSFPMDNGNELKVIENRVIPLSDITSLSSLNTAALVDGQQFYRGEFWPDTGVGAVNIKWAPNEPVANHNGGTVIDPAKISELDTVNKTFGTYFTADTLSGNAGCFVVELPNEIHDLSLYGLFAGNEAGIQPAIDNIGASKIRFPKGSFTAPTGGWGIPSGAEVFGFHKDTILTQPLSGVDDNVFFTDENGVSNVEIHSIELRGPFYQSSVSGYVTNPVQSAQASNAIQVRGREYQNRKALPITGRSSGIVVHHMHVEGFGEDAIQIDNADYVNVYRNTLTRCGRGGVRIYGCYWAIVYKNNISYLSPGDALNNGNRMYGVTFTRVYQPPLSDFPQSENCEASFNEIHNTPYWKALDTHGGKNIRFLYNNVREAHIAIGIDKGGFTAEQGIAPPSDITVIGNECIRTIPDDPDEGDQGVAGAALFVVAHDQTDEQVGRTIHAYGNTLKGWGENIRFGAVVYSNWIGVKHHDNWIGDSRRAAVVLRERFEGTVGFDTIHNVRRSSLGVQRGYAVESAEAKGAIRQSEFINEEATEMIAVNLSNPSSGKGMKVDADHVTTDTNGGGITLIDTPAHDQFGLNTGRLKAAGRVNSDGTLNVGRGISSVVRNSDGNYTVTVESAAQASSALWPVATPRGGSAVSAQADPATDSTITVLTKNASGAVVDGGFVIHVFSY